MENIKKGDFTGLAKNYSMNRPDYSMSVLNAILGLSSKPVKNIDFVDVGAGTGIWTRMVSKKGVKTITAIEPNEDMFNNGVKDSLTTKINWLKGCAENTTLKTETVDWVTMASSFHWVDFNKTLKEFYRILRPAGRFTALWNPRLIESNPLLIEIENYLKSILPPNFKRISSGRSGITNLLRDNLEKSNLFEDIIYIEGTHTIEMSKKRYLGVWNSVNDIRFQVGEEKFSRFIKFIKEKIKNIEIIKAEYQTRSWTALKK